MPLATIKAVLDAAPDVTSAVADRIGPAPTAQDLGFPAITLLVISSDPSNTIDADMGLDRCEVMVECWAKTYQQALDVATAARLALVAASHIVVSRMEDLFLESPGQDPGIYRVGYTHQVWKDTSGV